MLNHIKDEIKFYKQFEGKFAIVRVGIKTIFRIVMLPFALFGKIFGWVYYNDIEGKIDEIHERVKWGR